MGRKPSNFWGKPCRNHAQKDVSLPHTQNKKLYPKAKQG